MKCLSQFFGPGRVALTKLVTWLLVSTSLAVSAQTKTSEEQLGWRYEYDQTDRVTKVTDPAGRATQFQFGFDSEKRLRKVLRLRQAEPTVTREFDEAGRLRSMTDAGGTASYAHDDRGRLTSVRRQGAPAVRYAYDLQNRVTRLEVGDFYRVDYSYDFLGRLESMKTPAGTVQYDYQTGQGKVVRTLPNGIRTHWSYEPNGELKDITHVDARNAILAQYSYKYRADGLIEVIRELNAGKLAVKSYEYDVGGRLVKASGPSGQHAYEYDASGNRTKAMTAGKPTQTYTYDWAGRLKSIDGAATEHDAAGHLTALTIGGTATRYRHNQDGQLMEAVEAKVAYRYDGDGNLIGRSAQSGETLFVPDPMATIWRPLAAIGKGGRASALVWESGSPLLLLRGGRCQYFLHDHLGSVRLIVDSGGAYKFVEYEAFGGALSLDATEELTPFYAGLFWDPSVRVYLTRSRSYSVDLGRFLQRDPRQRVPINGNSAIYSYAKSDPVNLLDRDGAEPERPPFLDRSAVWWNAFWRDATLEKIFDRDRAMENYAGFAGSQLQNARGNGFAAGLTATLLDVAAGYVGGKPITEAQSLANLGWSFLSIANLKWESDAITGMAIGRTSWNYWQSMAKGDYGAAGFDVLSLGSDVASISVKGLRLVDVEERVLPMIWKWDASWPDWSASEYLGVLNKTRKSVEAVKGWLDSREFGDNAWQHIERWMPKPGEPDIAPASFARAAMTNRYDQLISGFRMGTYFEASARPLTGDELRAWQRKSTRNDRLDGKSQTPGTGQSKGGPYESGSYQRTSGHDVSPSPVGGIWLSDSSQAIGGLGAIEGVALDRNQNLVLISKAGTDIKLPSLRLDDVVTIFRSVYLYGEGPSVTIDPNPENPQGSAMIVRHGKATENTYVGWVLYQADRLMKCYTLGVDNISGKEMTTGVPGYADVLDKIFFGGENTDKLRQQGHWERFWIVPSETRQLIGPRKELTLFDMPLAVRTQAMKWDKGKLADDPQGKSSPGALAFKNWFTANYDKVAGEGYLTPPRESGITAPVPVFTELRRIALITAVAEKLRDQGVPLPFWMRDHEVRPVPFERTTPALLVPKSRSNVVARIFGGVNLSVADKDRISYGTIADVPSTAADAPALRQKLTLAGELEGAMRSLAPPSDPAKPRTVERGGASFQIALLPGAHTQALAPARLEEADIVVPVPGQAPIRLVRSYNSFFNPKGPWGSGWALDLPQLESIQVPLARADNNVRFQTGFELVTPLNSVRARFVRVEPVAELGGSRLLVPDAPGEFLGVADASPAFLSGPTRVLMRKDGSQWHFSKSGELVATEQGGARVIYERDTQGRLTRLVGLLGKRPVASIALAYDAASRIESANGKADQREVVVRYEYDANGRLAAVRSETGRTGYRYDGALLVAVARVAGKDANGPEAIAQRFEYGTRGQLRATINADGSRNDYRVSADAAGSSVSATSGVGKSARSDVVRYDAAMRPVEAQYADGTKVAWTFAPSGGTVVYATTPSGGQVKITEAADRRSRTVELDGRRQFAAQYDGAGRLTALADNGQPVLSQTWSPDGLLRSAGNDSTTAHVDYDADGLVARVVMAPRGESGTFRRWHATRFDAAGRPLDITDHTGLQTATDYDERGRLRSQLVKRDGRNYGFQIARDDAGRVREVKSSWDTSRYAYDAGGLLSRSEVDAGGQKSWADWRAGRLQRVHQFDGGETALSYYTDAKREGLQKEIITPNRLALSYDYDAANRLTQVTVGNNYRLLLDYDAKGRLAQWSYAVPKP